MEYILWKNHSTYLQWWFEISEFESTEHNYMTNNKLKYIYQNLKNIIVFTFLLNIYNY